MRFEHPLTWSPATVFGVFIRALVIVTIIVGYLWLASSGSTPY